MKIIRIFKCLSLIMILILTTVCLTLCDLSKKYFSVTIVSMTDDFELSKTVLTTSYISSIKYDPVNIVGYKFVGWEDNTKGSLRKLWLKDRNKSFVAKYEIDFLEAPVVIINTEDSKPITSKEDYVNCNITITNTEDAFEITDVSAGIRGRGNSTWMMPKKPFRIKFDSKQSLFGSSYKQKSWTLIANYADKSLSRNAIAYEMSQQFDDIEFTTTHQFVEVYLNNEYLGVYLLCDQIQTGTGRVDIDEDLHEDGDTGYLLELDARAPDEGRLNIDYFELMGNYYAIKTPDTEEDGFNAELYVNYIKDYLTDSMNSILSSDWTTVCNYIDVNSFADIYIIQELFYNPDVGVSSFYMYKDTGEKLYCGPLWDLDLSVNNHFELVANLETTLYAKEQNIWFKNLFLHKEFQQLVLQKLEKYNDIIHNCINLLNCNLETSYYKTYEKSFNRNFLKWNIAENAYSSKILSQLPTINDQMQYAEIWLNERYDYMIILITNIEY